MNYCMKCGAQLPEDALFCHRCGTTVSLNEQSTKKVREKPFYQKWWFWTIIALAIMSILVSVIIFLPSLLNFDLELTDPHALNAEEQLFVDCYNEYAKHKITNPDSVVITSISESVDKNGGKLFHFCYEYTTDIGYRTFGELYIVASKITIDVSLMTLNVFDESYHREDIRELNNQSVDVGYVTDEIYPHSSNDVSRRILSFWQSAQAESSNFSAEDSYSKQYNLEKINNAIK